MILTIDIGNTNIKLGLWRGKKIFYNKRIVTEKSKGIKQYKKILRPIIKKENQIEEILICSVVPKLNNVFSRSLFSLLKKKPLFFGKQLNFPVKNLYKQPRQVGQDRLANATAAAYKYGRPAIIVDFGTALTFDLVSPQGDYMGGLIFPGIELSLRALTSNAELLPKVKLGKPRAMVGKETLSSMKSGIVYGYSFLVAGMVQSLKMKFSLRPQIIATGGLAGLIARYCKEIKIVDKNLTLEGIRIAYEINKARKNKNIEK